MKPGPRPIDIGHLEVDWTLPCRHLMKLTGYSRKVVRRQLVAMGQPLRKQGYHADTHPQPPRHGT